MVVIMNHVHCMKRGIITISIPPATLSKFSKISQEFLFRREFYIARFPSRSSELDYNGTGGTWSCLFPRDG